MNKSLYRAEYQALLETLRTLREESGLTQAQCATALGRPQSFISDVESGIRRLDLIQLRDLCHVLKTDLPSVIRRFENKLVDFD